MHTLAPSTETTTVPPRIIEPEGTRFRDDWDKNHFIFHHNLAANPLFTLPALTDLAEQLLKLEGPSAIRWKNSEAAVDDKWGQKPPSEQIASVTEAIANLNASGSWVVLYRVQQVSEYAAVLNQALDEIETMTGRPLHSELTWKDSYIFMASPNATTPYHIDHECACLMQIHGDRVAHLWDQKDRSVLSELEIEEYYMGDIGSANYSNKKLDKATVYKMNAGTGVHHPSLAPHAYQNGPDYSVACGIHLCKKDIDRKARIYQANALLRRLGVKPAAPGFGSDQLKMNAIGMFDKKNPRTKHDLIRSGAMRARAPFKLLNKLRGK
jgi:uncharacterized glyoxalase superfamily protein PhnB